MNGVLYGFTPVIQYCPFIKFGEDIETLRIKKFLLWRPRPDL